MKRKLMSMILCATMLLGSAAMLASCAGSAGGKNQNSGDVGTGVVKPGDVSTKFLDKFPDGLNFADLSEDERILNVAYTEGNNGEFTRRSLQADDLDESEVDVATKARDARLLEQLGLELAITATSGGIGGMESEIGNVLASGIGEWDILAAYQYFGITIAKKGYLLNLNNLAVEGADYIDLDAPYWGKAFNDNMSYQGAYYWITGDLALRYIGGMYCTFVNASIYNEKLFGTYGSIYDIAKQGNWTLDLMTEMASMCYEDTGTVSGQADEGDTFGFGWESMDPVDGMALGAGVQYTFKDPTTGEVSISVNNQRTFDVSKKLNTLAKKSDFSYQFAGNDSANVMPAFGNGTVAFVVNKLFQAEAYLADMEDDYYIIPVPKFDETQANYITGIHDGCTIFGIPYDCTKIPQAAAALEFLCAYSSKDVAPLYYEGALKGRYTREPEAATMIDLIHDNVTTDFAIAWGNAIGGIPHLFRNCDVLAQNTIKRDVTKWTTNLNELTTELIKYKDGGEAEA